MFLYESSECLSHTQPQLLFTVCVLMLTHVEVRGQLEGVGSLYRDGTQVWQQDPLPTKKSH